MLIIFFKVAYIVGENRRRAEINVNLLNKFYTDQEAVAIQAKDNLPADAYVDPNLPYTQTGYEYISMFSFINMKLIFILGGLPTTLELKKWVPVMLTVNSTVKRYKENGFNF